jgi:hypothetical protein
MEMTMKNVVFSDIKFLFVPDRRNIAPPLQSPAGYGYVRFEVFRAVNMKTTFSDMRAVWLMKEQTFGRNVSPLSSG